MKYKEIKYNNVKNLSETLSAPAVFPLINGAKMNNQTGVY